MREGQREKQDCERDGKVRMKKKSERVSESCIKWLLIIIAHNIYISSGKVVLQSSYIFLVENYLRSVVFLVRIIDRVNTGLLKFGLLAVELYTNVRAVL